MFSEVPCATRTVSIFMSLDRSITRIFACAGKAKVTPARSKAKASGFTGKLFVFSAALKQGYIWLVVIGVLNTAISAYYYLRLIIVMFFRERTGAWEVPRIPASLAIALLIFGPSKLADLGKGLGEGIRNFKSSMKDGEEGTEKKS